jgi:hypothetical protein
MNGTIERTRIDRDGNVFAGFLEPLDHRGFVDKYEPVKSTAPWRGIKLGGRVKNGFRTRREAADWVVTP